MIFVDGQGLYSFLFFGLQKELVESAQRWVIYVGQLVVNSPCARKACCIPGDTLPNESGALLTEERNSSADVNELAATMPATSSVRL